MALLEVRQLTAFHGDVQALWDVSFEVAEGSITTLLGSNGAGKTTTLRTISGILPPRDGEIRLGHRGANVWLKIGGLGDLLQANAPAQRALQGNPAIVNDEIGRVRLEQVAGDPEHALADLERR